MYKPRNRRSGGTRSIGTPMTGWLLPVFIAALSACDMGSYNPIGAEVDPFSPLGDNARGWFSAAGDGSASESTGELLMLEFGDPGPGEIGGFVYIEVKDSRSLGDRTEMTLIRGIYSVVSIGANIDIELQPTVEYQGTYQQTSNPSNNPPARDRSGESSTITLQGFNTNTGFSLSGKAYIPLDGPGGILADIDADPAPLKHENLARLYQIGIYASQVIVPGFGGTGMLAYYNNPTPFNGLINGSDIVNMTGNILRPDVDFDYEDMINVPGLSMNGRQRSNANASGNGSLSETVDVDVDDGAGTTMTGSVNYTGISITGTIPSSGSYQVTIDGDTRSVAIGVLNPGGLYFTTLVD